MKKRTWITIIAIALIGGYIAVRYAIGGSTRPRRVPLYWSTGFAASQATPCIGTQSLTPSSTSHPPQP